MTTYPKLEDIIAFGEMNGCAYWTLKELSNGQRRPISEVLHPDSGTLDIKSSLESLRNFVEFYEKARPGTIYEVTFRRTKTSNGGGVYAGQDFMKDGGTGRGQENTPIQQQGGYEMSNSRYEDKMEKLQEQKEAFLKEQTAAIVSAEMLKRDIKDFEEKKKAYEAELKELKQKYDDKVEIAKNGAGIAISKILKDITGMNTGGGIKGLDEKPKEDEPLAPQQEVIAEIADLIDKEKYPIATVQHIKAFVMKVIEQLKTPNDGNQEQTV
jgi:hypothetical protein